MLLNVPELQEMLDAVLFEPGVWSPDTQGTLKTESTRVPLLIPPPTFDHMVTPCGLLFQELTTSPLVLCTALEDILIQAIEMDTGTYNTTTSEILLYVVRLIIRVESFMNLILERAALDDEEDLLSDDEETNETTVLEEKKEKKQENDTNETNETNDKKNDNNCNDNNDKYFTSACCARGLSVPIVETVTGESILKDPVDVLRHAKSKLRNLLDHRVMYILERWCNNAMKSRNMIVAAKLHTHLAYIQKNKKYDEYSGMSISILLISQMFLTSRVNFDTMMESAPGSKTKEEKEENNAIVHQLGLPQTEIFDLFQSTRNIILKYLRHHPLQKNKILESVVRVVTLTGTRNNSHDNDTTEDRGDIDSNREWIELSSLNKYGLIHCDGRYVPTTEHSKKVKRFLFHFKHKLFI